jgi:hypothetical protein
MILRGEIEDSEILQESLKVKFQSENSASTNKNRKSEIKKRFIL